MYNYIVCFCVVYVCLHMSVCLCLILDAAATVNVPCVLFDGSLGDEGRVLCVTWYLHAPAYPLSCRMGEREREEKERE